MSGDNDGGACFGAVAEEHQWIFVFAILYITLCKHGRAILMRWSMAAASSFKARFHTDYWSCGEPVSSDRDLTGHPRRVRSGRATGNRAMPDRHVGLRVTPH